MTEKGKLLEGMNPSPLNLLRLATREVPAVKYAIGVGGIAAIVAIVLSGWKLEAQTAIFGTLIVFGFMVVLVIFAALSKLAPTLLKPLCLALAWAFLLIAISVAVLFISCAFFDEPKSLPCLLKGQCAPATESPAPHTPGASAQREREVAAVEEQLSLTFFQFFEARYLDRAKQLLNALTADGSQAEPGRRLDMMYQILRLSFIEPDISDNKSTLLVEFEKSYPTDPWVPMLKAAILYAKRDFLAAAQASVVTSGQQAFPKASTANFFAGVCYLRAARNALTESNKHQFNKQALDFFAAAKTLASSESFINYRNIAYPSAIHFQGIVHYYEKRTEQALQVFQGAAQISEGGLKARALNGIGYIYLSKGNLDAAEAALTEAMDMDPTFPYARSNYGYVLLAKGDMTTARTLFEKNASDEKLKAESYRDVVLARLGLVHLSELNATTTAETVEAYAAILVDQGIQDFSGVSPLAFRLIQIQRTVAKRIYLSKDYYGLEVFALALLTRAYGEASALSLSAPADARITTAMAELRSEIASTRAVVGADWLAQERSGWFASIHAYEALLATPAALQAQPAAPATPAAEVVVSESPPP